MTIATGHRADGIEDPACDWQRLAPRGSDTLVFLMGVHNLALITSTLIDAGRSPDTPAAVVQQATCADQRTVTGTLADWRGTPRPLGSRRRRSSSAEVVRLREKLAWFDPEGREAGDSYALPAARVTMTAKTSETKSICSSPCSPVQSPDWGVSVVNTVKFSSWHDSSRH